MLLAKRVSYSVVIPKQIIVHTIARSLYEVLSTRPFIGSVWSRFKRACNLVDAAQQTIIDLTSPQIGNGPFSIVIEDRLDFFAAIEPNQPVSATSDSIKIGGWHLDLSKATVWNPHLPHLARPLPLTPTINKILEPYGDWPRLASPTPAAQAPAHLARRATHALTLALVNGDRLEPAVERLAGLGGGLTPAGDDYLVGLMAALC